MPAVALVFLVASLVSAQARAQSTDQILDQSYRAMYNLQFDEALKKADGAKALALLEGKPVVSTPAAVEGRFIVQVGAFTDAAKARETRLKVEKTGLKTYTHVAEGKEGKLIRVRVGPFGTKAEAEKAAEKVKALDMKAAILAL